MTPPESENGVLGDVKLPNPAKVILMLGVLPAIIGALLYMMDTSIKSMETKIDGHALKSDIMMQHLSDEEKSHTATIHILQQMCVMQASTSQERRDCLK